MRIRKYKNIESPTACPKCQLTSLEAISYSDTVDFRSLELDVEGMERYRCISCGFSWETTTQTSHNQEKIKDAYATARDRLRQQYGMLTGDQIEQIRKTLSLTQREASALFGGGLNSFNKYESGEVLQSYAMDRLVRLTDAIGDGAVKFLRNVTATHSLRGYQLIDDSDSESARCESLTNELLRSFQLRTATAPSPMLVTSNNDENQQASPTLDVGSVNQLSSYDYAK